MMEARAVPLFLGARHGMGSFTRMENKKWVRIDVAVRYGELHVRGFEGAAGEPLSGMPDTATYVLCGVSATGCSFSQ